MEEDWNVFDELIWQAMVERDRLDDDQVEILAVNKVVEGWIWQIDPDKILVYIGSRADGVLPTALLPKNGKGSFPTLRQDGTIKAVVVKPNTRDNFPALLAVKCATGRVCQVCSWLNPPDEQYMCQNCGTPFANESEKKEVESTVLADAFPAAAAYKDENEEQGYLETPPARDSAPGYQKQERHQPEQGQSRLGKDILTGQPVDVPQFARRQGLYIIGIQGTGKSVLIENLIIQDIKQNNIGVCVLDPHGDLINAVLARLPDHREKDVIYLDIMDYRYPFGINLFECPDPTNPVEVQRIVDQVIHVFEKLLGVSHDTPLILNYLRSCTRTLITNPGYTMADIPLLLQDSECRRKLVANVTDIDVQRFWRLHDQKKPADQNIDTASTLRRVDEFLQPLSRNIVGQGTSTINIRQVMDEGKILLVKLDTTVESITELIGSLFIALFLNAAKSRADLPTNKRRQFNLYADEFQRFATEDFATLLEEARKYAIATTIAHQNRGQLDSTNRQLETNLKDRTRSAANLVAFRVNSKDAGDLAGEFDITPQEAWEEELEKEWEEELEEEWVEVLKEEWTEKVEDEVIDGEEPVQVYKREIVDHLLKQGHEDERVMQFVRTYLQPLSFTASSLGNSINKDEIRQALENLNVWLYEGMVNPNNLFQPLPELIYGVIQFLTDYILPDFRNRYRRRNFYQIFFDFWYHFNDLRRGFLTTESEDQSIKPATEKMRAEFASVSEKLLGKVQATLPQTAGDFHTLRSGLFSQSQFHRLYQDAVEKRALYEAKQVINEVLDERERVFNNTQVWLREREGIESAWRKTGKTSLVDGRWIAYHVEPNLPPGEYERWVAREKQEKQEQINQGFSLFDRFTESLQLCQFALWQRPLMTTQSGLYQPRKRTQVHYITHPRQTMTHPRIAIMHPRKTIMHPQRTYADVLNEVASQLTNLPVFTAKVKITTDAEIKEHTIRTLDPMQDSDRPLLKQALEDRIARIKTQNMQDGYVRERIAVEAEIRQRQEQCSEQSEPPDELPISRRPQR